MEERIICLLRDERYGLAAELIASILAEENFFEARNILKEINERELDKLLLHLRESDRQAVLKLILRPEEDIPITEETAAVADENDFVYINASSFRIFKKRIPWLLILLISATFTSLIITRFESRLNFISPLLIACVPMMMDTGGNSGAQASVTVIRSIAMGEILPRDALKILGKELNVALMTGGTLAATCFLKLILIDRLIFGQPFTLAICFTVSLTLFITVIIAKSAGCTLPLLAKALQLDPAVVVSPFITTVIDAVSLTLYCIISVKILS